MALVDSVVETVAMRAEARHKKHRGVHAIVYPFDDGRTQVVNISIVDSWTGRPLVLFYSIIGRFRSDLDFQALLAGSLNTHYGRICLIQNSFLAVAASLNLQECKEDLMLSSMELRVREIALMADNLEQEFFGVDEF